MRALDRCETRIVLTFLTLITRIRASDDGHGGKSAGEHSHNDHHFVATTTLSPHQRAHESRRQRILLGDKSCYSLCNDKTKECTLLEHRPGTLLEKYLVSVKHNGNFMVLGGRNVSVMCHNCEDNTIGHRCESCMQGFYNVHNSNARIHFTECKPCECNHDGSENLFCNSIDGICKCKRGYRGEHCKTCADKYHHPLAEGRRRVVTKCVPDLCDNISDCRKVDSQAHCLYGVCVCSGRYMGDHCTQRSGSRQPRFSSMAFFVTLLLMFWR